MLISLCLHFLTFLSESRHKKLLSPSSCPYIFGNPCWYIKSNHNVNAHTHTLKETQWSLKTKGVHQGAVLSNHNTHYVGPRNFWHATDRKILVCNLASGGCSIWNALKISRELLADVSWIWCINSLLHEQKQGTDKAEDQIIWDEKQHFKKRNKKTPNSAPTVFVSY